MSSSLPPLPSPEAVQAPDAFPAPVPREGARVLGIGYAIPYLEPWRAEAERVFAFMPARQGVVHWPQSGLNDSALVEEADLPLPDASIDLALVVHGLELTDQLPDLLRELWRVLAPQGRALFVVPNRRGMWARFDSTPFGHGRPFSRGQFTDLLRDEVDRAFAEQEALAATA